MASQQDNSGLLLALLKERHPNWYRLAPRVIASRLTELAEAINGNATAVPGIMSGIERLQAYELEQVETEARRQEYMIGLNAAKGAASGYYTGVKEQTMLEARHTEALVRIERARAGNAATVARFLRQFPEVTLLPEWPRLDDAKRPENLAATAEALLADGVEYLKLKRHQAELDAARALRASLEVK